jgi:hypothetical protein
MVISLIVILIIHPKKAKCFPLKGNVKQWQLFTHFCILAVNPCETTTMSMQFLSNNTSRSVIDDSIPENQLSNNLSAKLTSHCRNDEPLSSSSTDDSDDFGFTKGPWTTEVQHNFEVNKVFIYI